MAEQSSASLPSKPNLAWLARKNKLRLVGFIGLTLCHTGLIASPLPTELKQTNSSRLGIVERQSGPQIIPSKSAVVGKVLLDIVLDPGRKYDMPVTLLSAIPIYDKDGGIAIPAGSIITVIIQKRDGGDYMTVDSIVYRGLNISIACQGRLIPAQIRPENYGEFIEQPKSKVSSALTASQDSVLLPTLLAVAIANSYKYDKYGYKTEQQNLTPLVLGIAGIDLGVKLLAALFDNSPKSLPPLVEIPADSLIVFTTASDTELPASNAPATALGE